MNGSRNMPGQLDQFLYTGNDGIEDLNQYKRLGYHPVILGDVLPKPGTSVRTLYGTLDRVSRYRVLLKLGFGAFATVWLARDLFDKRYVSLKLCIGSDTPEFSNEATILYELQKVGRGKAGHERIIQLFDAFIIKGPNGFHECLVTEVISPLSDPAVIDHYPSEAIHQILEGFYFLPEQGIVHGDPHLANFGVALPLLEQFSEDDITDDFGNPEVIPVVPRDISFPLSSIPPYVTPSASIAEFLQNRKCFPAEPTACIIIFDFGRAHRTSEKLTNLQGATPTMIRPPEVVVYDKFDGKAGSVWSKSADIWALGCTVYEIEPGSALISTRGPPNEFLLRAVQLGGPPPAAWPRIWNKGSEHGNYDASFRSRDEAWGTREASRNPVRFPRGWNRQVFLDLVQKMIVTDPDERSPVAELLSHRFVAVSHLT